jgi:hypothetical protein
MQPRTITIAEARERLEAATGRKPGVGWVQSRLHHSGAIPIGSGQRSLLSEDELATMHADWRDLNRPLPPAPDERGWCSRPEAAAYLTGRGLVITGDRLMHLATRRRGPRHVIHQGWARYVYGDLDAWAGSQRSEPAASEQGMDSSSSAYHNAS